MDLPLVAAVIGLGVVHGVLPDHGWPIAATYALEFPRKWFRGTVAALILGVGHLVSSIALVLAYFWIATFAEFAEGPWMKPLAGSLLIALGLYEYVSGGHGHAYDEDDHEHGHDHHHDDHGHEHSHDHDDHGHEDHQHEHNHGQDDHHQHDHGHEHAHAHSDANEGLLSRIRGLLPGDGDHQHLNEEHAQQGLMTLGVTALLLGFAHEEPVQILAICAGTEFCLELMLIYSLAVIVAILVPTLLLVAGYEHYQEQVERYTPYLPTITAIVLVAVGSWFVFEGLADGGLL